MTAWWQNGAIYQIYPRSFADGNGDGIGDLAGIIDRLDHLRGAPGSLGVDALWLSPIYPSPLADFGYDVSDYLDVDPVFGDLPTFDRLVSEAHRRGLRVLLDLVPCHTSSEHPWFVESQRSRSSPKRDWYHWADPAPDGGPPNNWLSVFGGPAWELDESSGQYYLHSFYPEQPDLNWRNPALAEAFGHVLRFWRTRGVDGFRIDAIDRAVKDPLLRDNPPAAGTFVPRLPERMQHELRLWNKDRPEVLEVVRTLRRSAAAAVPDGEAPLLIGESYIPIERMARYLGDHAGDAFDLVFDFDFLFAGWDAPRLRASIDAAEALLPDHGWPCRVLSNHDVSRHATRFGVDALRATALLLLTLRGTPVLYMGEEIGMVDSPPTAGLDRSGRDVSRSPMHWDASPTGGFTAGIPWLAPGDTAACNVADQRDAPDSTLSLYRRLLALRHESPAIGLGTQRQLDLPAATPAVAFLREHGDERRIVAVNCGPQPLTLDLAGASRGRLRGRADITLATDPADEEGGVVDIGALDLRGNAGVVLAPAD